MTENAEALEAQSSAAETGKTAGAVHESDHALVRTLLFLQASIAGAPGIARGLWRHYGKHRLLSFGRHLREYRPHPALYLAAAMMIFGGASFLQTHQLATGVSVNGTHVGAVSGPAVFQSARAYVQSSASSTLGYDYSFEDESLRTYPMFVTNGDVITKDALIDEICEANNTVAYSYVLNVNGEDVGFSGSMSDIETALADKLNAYTTENTISAEYLQDLEINKDIVPESTMRAASDISTIIDSASQEEVVYTIQAGDTWSQIASRHDMSSTALSALNPAYDPESIHEGEELLVSAAVPLLSVKVVDRVRYQTPIPYQTEYVEDPAMYQGETRVVTKGVDGVANVDAHVTRIDGVETSRDVIDSAAVTPAVNEVLAKGTKERPKTMASGTFAWPTHGRLTSTFGGRASPGGIGSTNHKGIDIAASRGTTISASDGGTVTYAGWMSGYGYIVIIDHNNGYQTRYAHNSKLCVSVGTKVYKGQKIAEMGSTGNSTGNHCHFEVRVGGKPVNPLNYLP